MIALLLAWGVGPFVTAVDVHGDPLPPHAVAHLGSSSSSVAFYQSGRRVYVAEPAVGSWAVSEWGVGDWKVLRTGTLFKGPRGRESHLTLTPGGRFAVLVDQADRLHVRPREDDTGRTVTKDSACFLPRYGLSADQSLLAILTLPRADTKRPSGQFVVLTLPDLRTVRVIDNVTDLPPLNVLLSPDGTRLVATGHTRTGREMAVILYEVATGRVLARLSCPWGTLHPAFSPDGALLALPARAGARVIDLSTLAGVASLDGPPGTARTMAFSSDGRLLAVGLRRDVSEEVVVFDAAGGGRRFTLSGSGRQVAFSPDTRYLAASGQAGTLVFDLSGLAALTDVGPPDWEGLGAADPLPALRTFLARPAEAVRRLGQRVRAALGLAPSDEEVRRLIGRIAADGYEARERAGQVLAASVRAGPFLESALREEKDLEVRRRLERLLAERRGRPGLERIREARAVEVLEHLATPEARELLAELAAGNADARLTLEAAAALRRMRR